MSTQIERLREIYDKCKEFPLSWTRYLSLDPGTAKAAVLFGVVPPPDEFGKRLIIESEIYALRMPPSALAPEVARRIGSRQYEAFIIDFRAGRQTTLGSERTVEEQYSNAFADNGVECAQTGSHFIPGSDDMEARANEVREWLYAGQKGGPRLLIVAENCIQTVKEFNLYKRKILQKRTSDGNQVSEKAIDAYNDCMVSLEYLVDYNPGYVSPPESKPEPDDGYKAWKARKARQEQSSSRGVHLGPPIPA